MAVVAITRTELNAAGLRRAAAYAPQFNPVGNVWAYLRGNALSNRMFDGCDAIVSACSDAWNSLIAARERSASIAARLWAQVKQRRRWY